MKIKYLYLLVFLFSFLKSNGQHYHIFEATKDFDSLVDSNYMTLDIDNDSVAFFNLLYTKATDSNIRRLYRISKIDSLIPFYSNIDQKNNIIYPFSWGYNSQMKAVKWHFKKHGEKLNLTSTNVSNQNTYFIGYQSDDCQKADICHLNKQPYQKCVELDLTPPDLDFTTIKQTAFDNPFSINLEVGYIHYKKQLSAIDLSKFELKKKIGIRFNHQIAFSIDELVSNFFNFQNSIPKTHHNKVTVNLICDKDIPMIFIRCLQYVFRDNNQLRLSYQNKVGETYLTKMPPLEVGNYACGRYERDSENNFRKVECDEYEIFDDKEIDLLKKLEGPKLSINKFRDLKIKYRPWKVNKNYVCQMKLKDDGKLYVNEEEMDLSKLEDHIFSTLKECDYPTKQLFHLNTAPNVPFESYLHTVSAVQKAYSSIWNLTSQELYSKPYSDKLHYSERKKIKAMYPYVFSINVKAIFTH